MQKLLQIHNCPIKLQYLQRLQIFFFPFFKALLSFEYLHFQFFIFNSFFEGNGKGTRDRRANLTARFAGGYNFGMMKKKGGYYRGKLVKKDRLTKGGFVR